MRRIATSALTYAAAILLLGTARTLWLAPRTGPLGAVALELPLMLGASAALAARIVRKRALTTLAAVAVGLAAFVMLMAGEWVLAATFGQTGAQWLAAMRSAPGLLGLSAQVVFALLPPVLAWRRRERH